MDPQKQLGETLPMEPDEADLVCGVDRQLVEDFLDLIKNNYRQADAAAAFLEHRARVSNVHAFTNVRDVLSHLCSMLDPATPPDRKRDQLNNAEEHLRRSILEPYEVGFSKLTEAFIEVYEKYKQFVEPIIDRYVPLNSAPTIAMVDSRLREIHELTRKGRSAKGRNLWTPEWEAGVASFIEAYDKLSTMKSELEGYYYKYERIKHDEDAASALTKLSADFQGASDKVSKLETDLTAANTRSTRLSRISIAATVITFLLAIIVAVFLAKFGSPF